MLPHIHQFEGVYRHLQPLYPHWQGCSVCVFGGCTSNSSTREQWLDACHCAVSPKSFTVNNWLLLEGQILNC